MKFTIVALLILCTVACSSNNDSSDADTSRDYKQDMRDFVIGISQKAKAQHPGFYIIPQNGIEIVTTDGEATGSPATAYLNAIDGNGQEDLFYGYDNDDVATPAATSVYLKSYLDVSKNAGKTILVTDYCSTASKISDAYQKNTTAGYVPFAAIHRNLDVIPSAVPNENINAVTALSQVQNFMFIINPENYISKSAFIYAVTATNYDLVIIDLFFNDEAFTTAEINQLRNKANGGKRLVICYMSIGEVEDYRYYWQESWNSNKPDWIAAENPDWPGNYKVKYWNIGWQGIIYKNDDSYLNRITNAGFDGVYLDIIDAFEYFEN